METTKVDQLTGTWVNQLDSRLYVEKDPSGNLRGSYVSAVSDLAGRPYPLRRILRPRRPGRSVYARLCRWLGRRSFRDDVGGPLRPRD